MTNTTNTTKKATRKSYAIDGHGNVCMLNSKFERDEFVRLVNEKLDNDRKESRVDPKSYMTACTAREAYAVRDKVDMYGERGSRYFDMNVIEFFDGDWDVFDQMPA